MADFTTLMLFGCLLMVLVVSRTHLLRKKRVHQLWIRKILRFFCFLFFCNNNSGNNNNNNNLFAYM